MDSPSTAAIAESSSQPLPRLCFLGIGLMGTPMARRLLQAGYAVQVWNREAGKALVLQPFGASCADSVAQAVQGVQIIISMLSDGAAVRQVQEQALPHLRAGQIWLEMSSTRQDEAQQGAQRLAAVGVAQLDAPVSGGVVGAEQGSLAIMAGGDTADFARAEKVLQVLGRPNLVGPSGSGQLAKLCNQLIVGGTLQLVAEALLLAQAGGADPAAVRQALRGGFAESRVLEVHGQRMLERHFVPGGQIKSQVKDLHNVMAAAQGATLQLPLAQLLTQSFQALLPELGSADQAAVLLGLERANPGRRLGTLPDQLP